MSASKMSACLGYGGKQGLRWYLGPGTEGRRSPVPHATELVGDGNKFVSVVSCCGYLIHRESGMTATDQIM